MESDLRRKAVNFFSLKCLDFSVGQWMKNNNMFKKTSKTKQDKNLNNWFYLFLWTSNFLVDFSPYRVHSSKVFLVVVVTFSVGVFYYGFGKSICGLYYLFIYYVPLLWCIIIMFWILDYNVIQNFELQLT